MIADINKENLHNLIRDLQTCPGHEFGKWMDGLVRFLKQ